MKKNIAILYALLAAIFYAINIPLSKLLIKEVGTTLLAGLLYLGAGIGIGCCFLFTRRNSSKNNLTKSDLPYIIMMVVLDIVAPILMMYGLKQTTAGTVSLLNNFEIVATSIIAFVFFHEKISIKLLVAILLVSIASFLLCFEDVREFEFSSGAIFIILATICWGLENNSTRKISNKNNYQIVMIKGLCCGIGSIIIAICLGESFSVFYYVIFALCLGFVSYGLSILFYVKAQSFMGASKTSAFYAINPFIATTISVIVFNEVLKWNFYCATAIMVVGIALVIVDVLTKKHTHLHTHTISYYVDGVLFEKTFTHSHEHSHIIDDKNHTHKHSLDSIDM